MRIQTFASGLCCPNNINIWSLTSNFGVCKNADICSSNYGCRRAFLETQTYGISFTEKEDDKNNFFNDSSDLFKYRRSLFLPFTSLSLQIICNKQCLQLYSMLKNFKSSCELLKQLNLSYCAIQH